MQRKKSNFFWFFSNYSSYSRLHFSFVIDIKKNLGMFALFMLLGLGSKLLAKSIDIEFYEEINLIIKNKSYPGAKDESEIKLISQIVEPQRKFVVKSEESESSAGNE